MSETIKDINLRRAGDIREKIKVLTGLSDERINLMMYEIAEEYMIDLGMSEAWLSTWLKEPLFWGWWKQQWVLVDEVYYNRYRPYAGRTDVANELQAVYRNLHADLDMFPDDVVYEHIHATYEQVGQDIIRKITAK